MKFKEYLHEEKLNETSEIFTKLKSLSTLTKKLDIKSFLNTFKECTVFFKTSMVKIKIDDIKDQHQILVRELEVMIKHF